MNINIELDLPGIITQACAAERIQPLIDKAIADALKSAIDDATGYRSEFRKALTVQLATALPHGLVVDDVAKFQQVLNATLTKHVQDANTETVCAAINKMLRHVLPDVPASVKLSDFMKIARSGFHKEEHEAFYAHWKPSTHGGGWLSLDSDEFPGQGYGTTSREREDMTHRASYRIAVNKEGEVYSLRLDGKDILPNSTPNVVGEFTATLMAMYVGRTKLEVDIDDDDVREAAQEQYD